MGFDHEMQRYDLEVQSMYKNLLCEMSFLYFHKCYTCKMKSYAQYQNETLLQSGT